MSSDLHPHWQNVSDDDSLSNKSAASVNDQRVQQPSSQPASPLVKLEKQEVSVAPPVSVKRKKKNHPYNWMRWSIGVAVLLLIMFTFVQGVGFIRANLTQEGVEGRADISNRVSLSAQLVGEEDAEVDQPTSGESSPTTRREESEAEEATTPQLPVLSAGDLIKAPQPSGWPDVLRANRHTGTVGRSAGHSASVHLNADGRPHPAAPPPPQRRPLPVARGPVRRVANQPSTGMSSIVLLGVALCTSSILLVRRRSV